MSKKRKASDIPLDDNRNDDKYNNNNNNLTKCPYLSTINRKVLDFDLFIILVPLG